MSRARFPSRIRRAAVLAVFGVCGCMAALVDAAPTVRLFRSTAFRVAAIEPPVGWELSAAPPSPRLLATWAHRDGARLTLVAERAPSGAVAATLFDQSRASLEKQGWLIARVDREPQRVLVEAGVEKGRRYARQLYLVSDGYAYVLTVIAPTDQTAVRAREFEETVASFRTGVAP